MNKQTGNKNEKLTDKPSVKQTRKTPVRRKKRRRKKNVFLRIMAALFIVFGIFVIAIVGLIAGSLFGYVEDTELVDIQKMRLNLTSFVYVQDPETGDMIEYEQLYDTENRIWVSSSDIPENLKNAFVAIEDERFYSHMGIDVKRFAGAAIQYVTKKGSSSYGGSTITQQLVKNLTKDDDYSIKRKIQEAYRAICLEKELSKDEILEYYLNTIYLSQKCNGVASAAKTYFGKEVSELSLAECATIAGITQFPTKYDPLVNPKNNKQRQLVILRKMNELGFITNEEYKDAKSEELKFVVKSEEDKKHVQSYFVDAAIEQVIKDLMDQHNYTKEYATTVLFNGGLKIYLSMDLKMQQDMDVLYNDPNTFYRSYDSAKTRLEQGEVRPQSAMVVMDPYTGLVKALTGGRGEKSGNRTLNRATHTLRQPGSSIKPLSVYAPALEYGLVTPSTPVNDAPTTFEGDYTPRNDDGQFAGEIDVATALRRSRNVPAAKICNYLTTSASFDFVEKNFHVSSLVKRREKNGKVFSDVGLGSIALGGLTDGVTVIDMCAAYCVFPNGGKYIEPSLYTKVLDSKDEVILEHESQEEIAISETTAEDMIQMMTAVVTGGTGTDARLSGMRAAGKTGTTSNKNDRWFVGYTPYYVGATWFGYDQPKTLTVSGNPAAIAWQKVMTKAHEGLSDKPFLQDEVAGKYNVMLCKDSQMRATPECKELIGKLLRKADIPTKRCTHHPYTFNADELMAGGDVVEKDEEIEGIIEGETGGTIDEGGTPSSPTETLPPENPVETPSDPPGNEGIVEGI